MYRISLNWITDQLIEYGYSVKEDPSGDPKNLASFSPLLAEGVVEALNCETEDDIWDIVRRFEVSLNGNWAIENIISQLVDDIKKTAKRYGYDNRILFKLIKPKKTAAKFVFVVMDLDATIIKYQTAVLNESEDIEDVVDDNPTIDLLEELEKVKERELPPVRHTADKRH